MTHSLPQLLKEIRACRLCETSTPPLPHQARPVLQVSDMAPIRIIGQAPGTRVHKSGKPFTDPSGDRLRDWMGIDENVFYNESLIAITPMGFCFPGLGTKGGDLPPRKECAETWHDRLDEALAGQIRLTLIIGQYAIRRYLGKHAKKTLTETVKNWRDYLDDKGPITLVLPHPSWRNSGWIKKNPWFESDVLPFLREEVQKAIS